MRRLGSLVALLLTFVYAGASASAVVNKLEHEPGIAHAASHLPFSATEMEAEAGHHHHDVAADVDNDTAPGPQPDAKAGHHHADIPVAGTLDVAGSDLAQRNVISLRHDVGLSRSVAGLGRTGPERPPKTISRLNV